ncbi:hypothetical protein [Streptomyces sp. NPDC093984]|uniref:hypothetical protein n=1 Tax=Streptomyces sp. NPDC093984 TaxID=3366052 RepID=UPI00381278E7
MTTELPCVLPRPTPVQAPVGSEAISVGRYYGLQALNRLRSPGTVAVDPAMPGVYFFVAAGFTATWPAAPACGAVSIAAEFVLPPAERRTPPGPYWLVPPQRGTIRLTDGNALLAALTDVIPDWAEAAS